MLGVPKFNDLVLKFSLHFFWIVTLWRTHLIALDPNHLCLVRSSTRRMGECHLPPCSFAHCRYKPSHKILSILRKFWGGKYAMSAKQQRRTPSYSPYRGSMCNRFHHWQWSSILLCISILILSPTTIVFILFECLCLLFVLVSGILVANSVVLNLP